MKHNHPFQVALLLTVMLSAGLAQADPAPQPTPPAPNVMPAPAPNEPTGRRDPFQPPARPAPVTPPGPATGPHIVPHSGTDALPPPIPAVPGGDTKAAGAKLVKRTFIGRINGKVIYKDENNDYEN